MRCRTSGSSAKRTISWISFLPPSSAGCDLPAMISCTGRSGWSRIFLRRAGSRSISVSRLYDGTRRAKPIVSTSGSRALSTQPSSALAIPRLRFDFVTRRRASCTSRSRSSRLTAQISVPGTSSTARKKESTSSPSGSAPREAASSMTSRATHVGACTPLVIEPIGTSASSNAGHRPLNISRLTWPCSSETPLARCEIRKPITAMLKTARVAALVVLGAEGQHVLDGYAGGRAGLAEVLLDELAREPVDARRDRRVRGEHGRGAGDLEGGVPVELRAVGADGQLADPLQAEEAGVALVGVEHLGGRVAGDAGVHAEGADAADAEQHLLAEAVLLLAAVQAVGDLAVLVGVALDVGVQEQQRHAADAGDPDAGEQVGAAGHLDRDGGAGAVVLAQEGQRQLVGVEDRVGLLLPALTRERLLEVARLVEQAHADQRDAEVRGGLEVVTGEDAEAAGVLREHRGDAELRREVADRAGRVVAGLALVPAVGGEVGVEVGLGGAQPLDEPVVLGQLGPAVAADGAEEAHRVVADGVPRLRVDRGEDVLRRGVPGPPQVARQVRQWLEHRGEDGTDRESTDCAHRRKVAQFLWIDPILRAVVVASLLATTTRASRSRSVGAGRSASDELRDASRDP